MRVSEILREKPYRLIALPPTATALEAGDLMKVEQVGAVLVLDAASRLLGVVSERDLVLDWPPMARRSCGGASLK